LSVHMLLAKYSTRFTMMTMMMNGAFVVLLNAVKVASAAEEDFRRQKCDCCRKDKSYNHHH